MRHGSGLASGLLLGTAVGALVADPRAAYPVAVFGSLAASAENRCRADTRGRGVLFTAACLGPVAAAGWALQRLARGSQARGVALTAAATWTVLGAASLAAEATGIQRALAGDLDAVRRRRPALCGRDRDRLDELGIARATAEPMAETAGAAAGIPGLLAYRAVDTLGAMAGHRSTWYERFGWAAARLDGAANWVPARRTVLLTVALAHWADGSGRQALRTLLRDGAAHPSPSAGRCEAAFAGALGVRLGGTNVYHGVAGRRGQLGDGPAPEARDIGRAALLSRMAAVASAAAAWLPGGRAQWPGGATRAPAGRRWPW